MQRLCARTHSWQKKSSTIHSLTVGKTETARSIAFLKFICDNTVAIKQQKRSIFFPQAWIQNIHLMYYHQKRCWYAAPMGTVTNNTGCNPEDKCSPSLLWECQNPQWMSWCWWGIRTAAAKFVLQVVTVPSHSAENNSWLSSQSHCFGTPFISPV
jgi:hypothetical protein